MEQVGVLGELSGPEIDFLLLADRAEAVAGKLYMMGGAWDRIQVPNFAAPMLISVAVGILVPWNACNEQHQLQVEILTIDDTPIGFRAEIGFVTGRPPFVEQGTTQRTLLAFPTLPVTFPGPGAYLVSASLNGQRRKAVTFTAMAPIGPPQIQVQPRPASP